jgi:xanthine dehydrogenase YagT iron-sulfur-binding subunit
VLVDGRPVYSCLTLAAGCEGQSITTVEGLASGESLHPLQRAFIEHDALQCGYCTPGQLMAAAALLLAGEPHPSAEVVRRGMSGNLCRCGAYPKIVRAVQAAASEMWGAGAPKPGGADGRP